MNRIPNTIAAVLASLFWVSAALAEPATWQQLRPLVAAAAPVGSAGKTALPETGPVIVTFFASWCPPCTDEFSHLNALAGSADFGKAMIIGINLYEDFGGEKNPARMTRFLKRTKPQFALIAGSERIAKAFGDIDRIPTVVVYGVSGREVWRFVHERGAEKTHTTIEEMTRALGLARGR